MSSPPPEDTIQQRVGPPSQHPERVCEDFGFMDNRTGRKILHQQRKTWDLQVSLCLQAQHEHQMQVMEMEAASLSLQHGGDHATSDNAQPPSPRTFLAVSPPQIGLEACPPKGWEKEREILQLQAELEAANAMVQALEGVSDGGPTASQHVPQYVPVAEPRVEEKVVYKYVQQTGGS